MIYILPRKHHEFLVKKKTYLKPVFFMLNDAWHYTFLPTSILSKQTWFVQIETAATFVTCRCGEHFQTIKQPPFSQTRNENSSNFETFLNNENVISSNFWNVEVNKYRKLPGVAFVQEDGQQDVRDIKSDLKNSALPPLMNQTAGWILGSD